LNVEGEVSASSFWGSGGGGGEKGGFSRISVVVLDRNTRRRRSKQSIGKGAQNLRRPTAQVPGSITERQRLSGGGRKVVPCAWGRKTNG